MTINLTNYYDIGKVDFWKTSLNVTMYDIELISKSTGEIITWSFTEEYFDKFLKELEEENLRLLHQLRWFWRNRSGRVIR